jgi:hypothetical protein
MRTWRSVTLPFEHMPEVTPTGSTDNLGAFDPQRKVHVASYSARDGWHDEDQSSQQHGETHI